MLAVQAPSEKEMKGQCNEQRAQCVNFSYDRLRPECIAAPKDEYDSGRKRLTDAQQQQGARYNKKSRHRKDRRKEICLEACNSERKDRHEEIIEEHVTRRTRLVGRPEDFAHELELACITGIADTGEKRFQIEQENDRHCQRREHRRIEPRWKFQRTRQFKLLSLSLDNLFNANCRL